MNYNLVLLTASAFLLFSCTGELDPGGDTPGDKPETVSVTGITIDKTTLTLTEGETATLVATVTPDNATNKAVNWTTSSASVATVDNNGKVTGLGAGTAAIIATTQDGGKTATCTVTVESKTVAVTGIALDKTTATLAEGESVTLIATVTPDNATDKSVNWFSSSAAVATVDNNGKVTGINAGTATITAITSDGGKKATCTVTVEASENQEDKPEIVSVTGITLDKTTLTLTEGETATLVPTVTPNNATNKAVSWTTSSASVATVDNNGKVTAVKAGTATITAITADGGKTATCTITVKSNTVAVTGVTLDQTSLTLSEGETATLIATVAPSNATNKALSWSSGNKAVATVDANGKITAVKSGTTTITVTTQDGGKTATCTMTVEACIVTGEAKDVTSDSATLTGYAYLPGGMENAEVGVMYDVKQSFAESKKLVAAVLDANRGFAIAVTGLNPDTVYYYRSYVQKGTEIKYGEVKSFTTEKTPPSGSNPGGTEDLVYSEEWNK